LVLTTYGIVLLGNAVGSRPRQSQTLTWLDGGLQTVPVVYPRHSWEKSHVHDVEGKSPVSRDQATTYMYGDNTILTASSRDTVTSCSGAFANGQCTRVLSEQSRSCNNKDRSCRRMPSVEENEWGGNFTNIFRRETSKHILCAPCLAAHSIILVTQSSH
jgi:hypothetical protein